MRFRGWGRALGSAVLVLTWAVNAGGARADDLEEDMYGLSKGAHLPPVAILQNPAMRSRGTLRALLGHRFDGDERFDVEIEPRAESGGMRPLPPPIAEALAKEYGNVKEPRYSTTFRDAIIAFTNVVGTGQVVRTALASTLSDSLSDRWALLAFDAQSYACEVDGIEYFETQLTVRVFIMVSDGPRQMKSVVSAALHFEDRATGRVPLDLERKPQELLAETVRLALRGRIARSLCNSAALAPPSGVWYPPFRNAIRPKAEVER